MELSRYGLAQGDLAECRGFMGVSICSRFFSRRNVRSIACWAAQTFRSFLFVVADDPQAYTFVATRGVDYSVGMGNARAIGDQRTRSIVRVLDSADARNCSVVRWRDICGSTAFRSTSDVIEQLFSTKEQFREDVLAQVRSRSGESWGDRGCSVIRGEAEGTAARYVLAEISAMIYLQEMAVPTWPIQVFPLPMPRALRGVYGGGYLDDPLLHRDRSGYIEISVGDSDANMPPQHDLACV